MKKKIWINIAIALAIVFIVIGVIKLLPLAWVVSTVIGFVGGVVCSYLWRTKL